MDMDERLHLDNTEYWRSDMQIIRIALHNINPIDVVPVMCNLNLNIEINKKNISPDEARTITLDTLHLKYPLDNWTHIYTDGSLTDCDEGAGAGGTCFFSFYKSGKNTTNFDGEIDAIYTSLQNLFIWLQNCQNIVILSDSKAAVQASINCPKMEKIKEIQSMLKQIQSFSKTIILQWIPAHCGIQGNEKANILAKKGSKIMQKEKQKLS